MSRKATHVRLLSGENLSCSNERTCLKHKLEGMFIAHAQVCKFGAA